MRKRDCKNRNTRPELGNTAGCRTTLRKDYDCTDIVQCLRRIRNRNTDSILNRPVARLLGLFKNVAVRQNLLCLFRNLTHHLARLNRIFARSRFRTEHHAVRTIQNSVAHIRSLCTRAARIVRHRIQHMRCRHNRLTHAVGNRNDVLLIHRNQLGRNLNAEITARNHHTIRSLQNRLHIVIAFLVLNLRDDVDLRFAFLDQNLADRIDIRRPAHERSRNEVNIVAAPKAQIRNILFRKERHRKPHTRNIAALVRADRTADFHAALHLLTIILQNRQTHLAIVDQNAVVRMKIIEQLRALNVETLMRPLNIRLLQVDNLTLLILFRIILETAQTDLRPLGIQADCQRNAGLFRNLADHLDPLLMFLMRPV